MPTRRRPAGSPAQAPARARRRGDFGGDFGGDFVWERAVQNRAAGVEGGMGGMVVELLDGGFDDVADPTVAVQGRME